MMKSDSLLKSLKHLSLSPKVVLILYFVITSNHYQTLTTSSASAFTNNKAFAVSAATSSVLSSTTIVNSKAAIATAETASPSKSNSNSDSTKMSANITSSKSLCEISDLKRGIDEPLMNDIELLSSKLEQIVQSENQHVYELYTQLRKHGMDRALDPNNKEAFEQMKKLAFDLTPKDTLAVMRVFSVMLNLINAAEVHHKLRVMRNQELVNHKEGKNVGPLPMVEDGVRGTIEKILEPATSSTDNTAIPTKEEIYQKLLSQKVEIVLTAHPTEVNRKTLLSKYRQVSETLSILERPDLHPYEKSQASNFLTSLIAATWGSDQIRRVKPTPQQEAAGGNAVIETVLWEALPQYIRKLDAQCQVSLGKKLPIDYVPIKFASWIGGDRDGNPNVTPRVTKEVVTSQRLRASKLFWNDLDALYSELAISTKFSPEMEKLAASVPHSKDVFEKYRRVIGHLEKRLLKTIRSCEAELLLMTSSNDTKGASFTTIGAYTPEAELLNIEPIRTSDDLMIPLRIMYDSLTSTGFELVAQGRLLDIIRRLAAFGTTLVPLDIREESTKHTLAMDAITRYLGLGSYKEWDEEDKINFLQTELSAKRPLFNFADLVQYGGIDDSVLTTLKTFETISQLPPEALSAYVISQATSVSDVLAVMLLQRQFGMTASNGKLMRVVPLFETLDDLTNAPQVLDRLFSVSQYTGAIKGKQEVMVGYSDSAKDAGRLAACWAQYTSQEEMSKVASTHKIELTFFHGKGGTVGRGGNPALYRAILGHPPGTINGRFRVTEQGEMITQNFGSPDIAERTLDIYTAAVLRECFIKHVEPTESWRKQMSKISEVSCADYRKLVRGNDDFVSYFRQATPELELGALNIGSRPAKRNPKGGIESLRAIPWTFAWTQSRLHLSAWLGVGVGLCPSDEKDKQELREMYLNWPWFREIVDLVAMILSKTDYSISENYENLLVTKTDNLVQLGREIRSRLVQTRMAVLEVTGSKDFGGPHVQLLRASSKIRHPYVDSINCVQAELLKELRNMGDEDSEIKNIRKDALIVSINGIACGMRNSG